MRDIELYRTILGLQEPWTVVNVEVDMSEQQVVVTVEPGPRPFPCPICQESAPGYDRKLRRWRHLDTCQFTTLIQAEVPRVECSTHGVKQLVVPWAAPGSQFTALFERLAIDLLRECAVKGTAKVLRIFWAEAWGIKHRAVARGLARRREEPLVHLGVDEKAIAKGHRYLTVVADLDRRQVLYLAEDRKQESLDRFWQTLSSSQQKGIAAIAMDMWEPYVQATRQHLEAADQKIVFDTFHVVKHLHDGVDRVRRAEHRTLKQSGDTRLTGTKYLWLMRPQTMTAEQRDALQRSDLKVARAWLLKEQFRHFWDSTYRGAAQKFFTRWFWRATHSRLQPLAAVAKRLKRHLPNVLTYVKHGITHAGLEAVNSTIQGVKKMARGFRNVENFKTAIYFHCGGLNLYPHESW